MAKFTQEVRSVSPYGTLNISYMPASYAVIVLYQKVMIAIGRD